MVLTQVSPKKHSTNNLLALPHLNEPPICAPCTLHLAPLYHTDRQSKFQGRDKTKLSERCLCWSLHDHEKSFFYLHSLIRRVPLKKAVVKVIQATQR